MEQVRANAPTTIQHTVTVGGDGTDLEVSPAPAWAIVDGNGATVTPATTAAPGAGVYQAVVDAGPPTIWRATLTGELAAGGHTGPYTATLDYEVVGNYLFTEGQLRTFRTRDGGGLSAVDFIDDVLAAQRVKTTDLFEEVCARSFVPRYCRAEFAGNGQRRLPVWEGRPRLADGTPLNRPGRAADIAQLLSVTIDGTTIPTSEVTIDGGYLTYAEGSYWTYPSTDTPLNVVVEWVYGLAAPPEDIREAGVVHARYEVAARDHFDRVYAFEGGARMSTPGPRHPTGLPVVDAALNRHSRRVAEGIA